ncbi:hypothetical protein FACS1894162_0910 [Bacteroidia bacterium]|nr:hypothetical protein FACS1894162_0910 [Bacteroidia bacterium]
MNRYMEKLKADSRGYIFAFIRELGCKINQTYYTLLGRMQLSLKGIKAEDAVFYNKPYFYRCPESSIKIGKNCIFDSSTHHNAIGVNSCCILATLTKQAQLSIGDKVGCSGVKIGCANRITIGDDCLVGANAVITDTDWHPLDPAKRYETAHDNPAIKTKPVIIGKNVFIGVNSIILKGSTIGDNSVIGAGSVVSGNIPANVIAAGNPCKVIKSFPN